MIKVLDYLHDIIVSIKNLSYLKKKCSVGFGSRVINSHLGKKVKIGKFVNIRNSVLEDYVRIYSYSSISNSRIGRYTYVATNTVVSKAKIGSFTSISWNVGIGPSNHPIDEKLSTHPICYSPNYGFVNELTHNGFKGSVNIGSDVWIGGNAIILRGVTIRHGAIIGAGSIVTKDIPPYAIAVGNPAKVIRYRFPKSIIKELLKIEWWNWPDEVIKQNIVLFNFKPDAKTIERLWEIKELLDRNC